MKPHTLPTMTETETETAYDLINANEIFDNMRNLISGAVVCRQCQKFYHEIEDTEIIDLATPTPAFYCTVCGERL